MSTELLAQRAVLRRAPGALGVRSKAWSSPLWLWTQGDADPWSLG